MPSEENSDYVTDKKDGDSRVESPVGSSGHHGPPAKAPDKNADEEHGTSAKLAEDIRTGERWIIGIGIATLVINTLIASIYWGQLGEMRKSTQAAKACFSNIKSAKYLITLWYSDRILFTRSSAYPRKFLSVPPVNRYRNSPEFKARRHGHVPALLFLRG